MFIYEYIIYKLLLFFPFKDIILTENEFLSFTAKIEKAPEHMNKLHQ